MFTPLTPAPHRLHLIKGCLPRAPSLTCSIIIVPQHSVICICFPHQACPCSYERTQYLVMLSGNCVGGRMLPHPFGYNAAVTSVRNSVDGFYSASSSFLKLIIICKDALPMHKTDFNITYQDEE